MKHSVQFRVRYQETDQMGVVHHSVYFIWFEMGRTEWLREFGLTYRECEERGWLLPLVESGCRYLAPARYDDLLAVETELGEEDGAIFHFVYTILLLPERKVLATGFTDHVCVNSDYRMCREGTRALWELIKARG